MYIVWLWLIIYSLHFVLEGFGNIWNGYGVQCLCFDYWLGWSMHPTPNKITEKGHEIWCDWKGHYSVAYRLSVLPVLITIIKHFFAGGWLSADFWWCLLCHIIFGVYVTFVLLPQICRATCSVSPKWHAISCSGCSAFTGWQRGVTCPDDSD